jgi:hypothetical protein
MGDWEGCTTGTIGLPNPNQRRRENVRVPASLINIYRYTARAFFRERFLAHEGEGITWIGQPSQESCYFQCV